LHSSSVERFSILPLHHNCWYVLALYHLLHIDEGLLQVQLHYIPFIACFKAPYPFSPSQLLVRLASSSPPYYIDKAYRRSSYIAYFTQMAAFQRLIIILMAICAMLSVIAVPLQVRQQPLQALILSDDAFSDVMATTLN